MKYIKSSIRWLLPNSAESMDDDMESKKSFPGNDGIFYAILSIIFLAFAFWFYHGTNFRLLGPPFGKIDGQDFRQILRASHEILNRENIYQHAIPYAESPDFGEFVTWSASPYPYSPIVAVVALPFVWLEEQSALIIWSIFSWGFLVGAVVVIVVGILGEKNWLKVLAVLLFFSIYGPVHLNLSLGQLDILILFLISVTFFLYKKESIYAGVFLGTAIAFKVLVTPMLIYFLWKKDWKTSAMTVVTAGLLSVIGFSVAGWGQLVDFIKVNYLWSVTDMLSYPFNQSINGLSLRFFTANPYIQPLVVFPLLVTILRVLSIAVAMILWLKTVNPGDNRKNVDGFLEYGFTLSTMFFLSPLVDDVHYVWLLLPIGAILALFSKTMARRNGVVLSLLTMLSALFLAHPDLHDAVYYGWENLAQNKILVSQKYLFLTGAYLYGLICIELCLLFTIHFVYRKKTLSVEVR